MLKGRQKAIWEDRQLALKQREPFMNRRLFLAASAATLALVSTTALAQAPRTVTLTHSSPANSHFGLAAVTFRDVVEKESNGRFKVVIQRLDNEREALESVQLGSQEFSMGSTGP